MKQFSKIVTAALAVVTFEASAITIDLTGTSHRYAAERNYSADGINLSVTGYTGGAVWPGSTYETGEDIHREAVGSFGQYGLGVEWAYSPNHAADNAGQNFDMFLFSFDQAVTLDALSIGWYHNDSDMSVFAYTGSGDATSTFAGNKWDQALANDWTGGHYLNVAQRGNQVDVNPMEVASTSWLIGTQLWTIGNVFTDGIHNQDPTGADYVKLKSISFTKPHSVPEIDASQSGIALGLMAAFFALIRERRKRLA